MTADIHLSETSDFARCHPAVIQDNQHFKDYPAKFGVEAFTDREYARLGTSVAARFPDLELLCCRPLRDLTVLQFRLDEHRVVAYGLIPERLLPRRPKRIAYLFEDQASCPGISHVRRRCGGFIEVMGYISEDIAIESPFSLFRCSAIRAAPIRVPFLRLVVDNT